LTDDFGALVLRSDDLPEVAEVTEVIEVTEVTEVIDGIVFVGPGGVDPGGCVYLGCLVVQRSKKALLSMSE